MIVLRGGEVLTADGWKTADVAVADGVVTAVGQDLAGDHVVDADGCLVGPGLVDMHTHLRDPGQTWKEDIASASAAAAAGGFTAVTAMPNTDPPMDTVEVVEHVLARAAENASVEVVPSAAITAGRAGESLAPIEDLYAAGVRLFTDDGDAVVDPDLLSRAMRLIAELPGAFIAQHAEDPVATHGGHMHDGSWSRRLGVGGLPAQAETDIVRRDLGLAADTGARYHCQHVSAKGTIELIETAKDAGLNVSAEVTPHHLCIDESSLHDLDTNYKMYPPLRTADDRSALAEALAAGVIDVVATDHAPHLPAEKAVPFSDAPRGVIGLETALSATWLALGGDRDRVFGSMATRPAELLGLEGQGRPIAVGNPANLVVFDPNASWSVPETFRSKSSNSAFLNMELPGRVRATLHRGQLTYMSEAKV